MSPARSSEESSAEADEQSARKEIMMTSVSLGEVLAVHKEMFSKLVAPDRELSMIVAELFEDIGNRYLDISEEITASILRNADPECYSPVGNIDDTWGHEE